MSSNGVFIYLLIYKKIGKINLYHWFKFSGDFCSPVIFSPMFVTFLFFLSFPSRCLFLFLSSVLLSFISFLSCILFLFLLLNFFHCCFLLTFSLICKLHLILCQLDFWWATLLIFYSFSSQNVSVSCSFYCNYLSINFSVKSRIKNRNKRSKIGMLKW